MNLRRIVAILLKELRQLRRDRLTLVMIAGMPTLQLLLFGFAINLDVRNIDAVVLDQSGTAASREFIATLQASAVAHVVAQLQTPSQVDEAIKGGRASMAIVIPADFDHRLASGERPAWQLVLDASDQTVQSSARQLSAAPLPYVPSAAEAAEMVNFYNPERRAAVNTVPGLIGVILTMTLVMFTSIAIVRERERGNLEMLIATPVSPLELTLGKVAPFVIVGLLQLSLILLLGRLVFSVPIRGAVGDVFIAALAFIIANLALGIFISTLSKTQFQAIQMAFFTMLPQILLSGFLFPFAGMPKAAQWIGELLPLTHFLRLIRGIMLRGASIADLSHELMILGLFAVIALLLAAGRMRKRLD